MSRYEMMSIQDRILEYMISLSTALILPTSIWLIASCRIFSRLRGFTFENYQERVRENIEETIIERMTQLLNDLFPQYGLTPSRSAPFQTIVRNLLLEVEAPERLSYLSDMYQSLVENGIQSPFFNPILQTFLTGGGG